MTDRAKPIPLDQASALAISISSDMNSIAFDRHNERTLQALQNDVDRLRRGGRHPETSNFVGQVQLDLDRLAKECQMPEIHISNKNGAIQFNMPQRTILGNKITNNRVVEATFTPGSAVQIHEEKAAVVKRAST